MRGTLSLPESHVALEKAKVRLSIHKGLSKHGTPLSSSLPERDAEYSGSQGHDIDGLLSVTC